MTDTTAIHRRVHQDLTSCPAATKIRNAETNRAMRSRDLIGPFADGMALFDALDAAEADGCEQDG